MKFTKLIVKAGELRVGDCVRRYGSSLMLVLGVKPIGGGVVDVVYISESEIETWRTTLSTEWCVFIRDGELGSEVCELG